MDERRHDFLEMFCQRMSDEIETYFVAACCISATKMGMAILQHFGIVASPLPVSVVAFDPKITKQIMETSTLPPSGTPGVVAVGRGKYFNRLTNPSQWAGHLCLWLDNERELIDPTLAQLNQYWGDMQLCGIRLSVRHCEQDPEGKAIFAKFWNEDGILSAECGPSLITYTRLQNDESYKEHVDWGSTTMTKSHVKNVIATLERMGFLPGEFGEKPKERESWLVLELLDRALPKVKAWVEKKGYHYHVTDRLAHVLTREPHLDSFRLVRALERDFLWVGDRELVAIFDEVLNAQV